MPRIRRARLTNRDVRSIALRQRQMEHEIGPNPKYRHVAKATAEEIAAWERLAHEWIRKHGRKTL